MAGGLASLWFLFIIYVAIKELQKFKTQKGYSLRQICHTIAFLYLPIGGIWAIADRIGYQPLGFSPTIVLLTAIHFHYAGCILPFISAKYVAQFPRTRLQAILPLIILGVPLVAIGITATQLQWAWWIEAIAVMIMTVGGFLVGIAYLKKIRLSFLWGIGGLSLSIGMLLAFLYGIRMIYPIPSLDIPMMYALHGTLNAIGFAIPILWSWKQKSSHIISN